MRLLGKLATQQTLLKAVDAAKVNCKFSTKVKKATLPEGLQQAAAPL